MWVNHVEQSVEAAGAKIKNPGHRKMARLGVLRNMLRVHTVEGEVEELPKGTFRDPAAMFGKG